MILSRQLFFPFVCYILSLLALSAQARASDLHVTDDAGRKLALSSPARRIVSLSPHATELIFAAGAGAQLIGVDASSNYPPAANTLPRIGRFGSYDIERIVDLHPDLIIGWASGTPSAFIEKLSALKIPIFLSEPHRLEDIATDLERIGMLSGNSSVAVTAATAFRQRLASLTRQYSGLSRVSVFYQIWPQPLATIGGTQIISRSLAICGGENVFGKLEELAPTVSREAVIAADPEVLITGTGESTSPPLAEWKTWPKMTAIKRGNLFTVNSDWLSRPTPRMLDGLEEICKDLEVARKKRR